MKTLLPRLKRSRSRSGFALVVVISLMILLVVIGIGLLTLSQISLRSSGRSMAMAEARQNARMALIIAIGQLQRQAGPDQRVTAIADIAGDDSGNPVAAGVGPKNRSSVNGIDKGLSSIQSGTRHWTGVWKNESADPGNDIFIETPSPLFQAWLISGNEARAADNRLVPGDATFAIGTSGAVSDPAKAVVLVGEGSVGGSAPDPLERYVVAPLVGIGKERGDRPAGRYAWWIGDEGIKARINIPQTQTDGTLYASLPAQRRGWESIDGLESYPLPDSPGNESLSKVVSLLETDLLMPDATADLRSNFHSATTDSVAVISDVLAGGTRIDLTSILSDSLPTARPEGAEGIRNYPLRGTSATIIPAGGGYPWRTQMRAPLWDGLREFYMRHSELENGEMNVEAAPSPYLPSISPLVTDFRILLGARLVPKGGAAAAQTANDFRVRPCAKIAITIANPYSVPLRWKKDLEFEITNQTPSGNRPSRLHINNQPAPDNLGAFLPYVPNRDGGSGAEAAVFHNAFFRIPAGVLPPGEARAFTMGSPVLRAAGSTGRVNVNLVPFASADPLNFENCIEMDVADLHAQPLPITLDVRESWQTSLAQVEMKLVGARASSEPLLRIESFEIDSKLDFRLGARSFSNPADARRMTKPFGMQLFNFQISVPGVNYANLFGGNSRYFAMGQRSSTMRTFADFNLAATRWTKPISCYNPPPYFSETSDSYGALPFVAPGGDTGSKFTSNMVSDPFRWGRGPANGSQTILFTIPEQITSLAQFQHADLTGDNDQASIGHQPGNAFGNSYAPLLVKRNLTSENRTNYVLIGVGDLSGARREAKRFYDISYLLNASIWDGYFLSTIPASGIDPRPQISAITPLPGASAQGLRDPLRAATELMITGGFNINSTDKNAWKAFLASAKHFRHKADEGSLPSAAFPRSLEQAAAAAETPTGVGPDSFAGYRRLTDAQLDALAGEITRQVRLRGPFLSLSHFVNRALAPLDQTTRELSRSGALQTALDESGININLAGNRNAFAVPGFRVRDDMVSLQVKDGVPRSDFDGPVEQLLWGGRSYRPSDADPRMPDWGKTSDGGHYGSVASMISDRAILNDRQFKSEQGYRSTGIPGWLTQADVLQVIGPSITARSDTFRIRAYGECLDDRGKVVAKAYCEAIIQRYPEYVDPSDPPEKRADSLNPTNTKYGRRFEVISFRWLSNKEV